MSASGPIAGNMWSRWIYCSIWCWPHNAFKWPHKTRGGCNVMGGQDKWVARKCNCRKRMADWNVFQLWGSSDYNVKSGMNITACRWNCCYSLGKIKIHWHGSTAVVLLGADWNIVRELTTKKKQGCRSCYPLKCPLPPFNKRGSSGEGK